MPPCSTNRRVTQLFRKSMPPTLKPGTHNQTLVPQQSLMRPFVLSLGTRDEKRQKAERKNKMLPLLPVIQGFDFASLYVISGRRSRWREGKRKKETREKRERAVWTCCGLLFACLSLFSINSAAAQPTSGGQLCTEPRLWQNLQIHTRVIDMNISQQREGSLSLQQFSLTRLVFTKSG